MSKIIKEPTKRVDIVVKEKDKKYVFVKNAVQKIKINRKEAEKTLWKN